MTDHEDVAVRAILERLEEHRRPTPDERARIEDHMWRAALDAERPQANAIDQAEIVRLRQGSRSDDPGRRPRRTTLIGLAAAAALAILVGVVATIDTDDGGGIVVSTDGDRAQVTIDLDNGPVTFEAPILSVNDAGDDYVELLVAENGIPASGPSGVDTITVARPAEIFGGEPADEWAAASGVTLRQVPARYLGEPIEGYTATIDPAASAERGCDLGERCIAFATLAASDGELSLEAGRVASIHLLPSGDDEEPLVLFTSGLRGIVGGFDPLIMFQTEILEAAALD